MPRKKGKPSRAEKLAHLDAALKYVKNFDTAIDVGAHWGLWTRRMAEHFGMVYGFEPMQENFERLGKNTGHLKNVFTVCAAIGDTHGRCRMEGTGHSQHYAVVDNTGNTSITTLDRLHKIYSGQGFESIGLIKTDCEGADLLALKGAEGILTRDKPVLIVERKRKFEKRYGIGADDLPSYLQGLGYRHAETLWCDHIFVPR